LSIWLLLVVVVVLQAVAVLVVTAATFLARTQVVVLPLKPHSTLFWGLNTRSLLALEGLREQLKPAVQQPSLAQTLFLVPSLQLAAVEVEELEMLGEPMTLAPVVQVAAVVRGPLARRTVRLAPQMKATQVAVTVEMLENPSPLEAVAVLVQ